MSDLYIYRKDLAEHAAIPEKGILSTTLQNDERSKVVHFVFAPGTELTAHTAPMPATLAFLKGEASVTLGTDTVEAAAGTFVYMTPQLEHGIRAKSEVVMLLTMIKGK